MRFLKYFNLKNIITQIKAEGVSMRRRFVIYIISAIAVVISLILLLLNVFGIINPTNNQIKDVLDTHLESYSYNIEHDYDQIAAYAISFSEQLEVGIQDYLTENNLSFDELKNNPEQLFSLQNKLYGTVYLNMQLAPSSGAFYILNTTVNSQSKQPLYNGIYLKYVNLYSESTLNNSITLYRGSYDTGKKNNLTFHSGWQNEMKTDFFDKDGSVFNKKTHYVLSPTVEIPDTWERSRYVYVPVCDLQDNIIGVCGYEVNDLYFQLSEKSGDSKLGQLVGALLDKEHSSCTGQFDSNKYNSKEADILLEDDFTIFYFDTEKCVGLTKSVKLGANSFDVAIMISEAQFENYINNGQLKIAGIILFVLLFAIAFCLFLSKKYISPIVKKIEQIKSNNTSDTQLKIREIDDLFDFLAERDNDYECRLNELENSKNIAEEEAHTTRLAYEKALEKYELAQNEISLLANERKKEIVLEEYEYFIANLKTLTPTEYRIYELYLSGKTATEITEILGIKENTIKFHNKNIYAKLGISSRKQLLRFAALKQQQDKNENNSI